MDPVVRGILVAAMAEFADHGFAGARVDAIAARNPTSKRMLYCHFGSKQGLYSAALAQAYQQMRQRRPVLAPTAGLPPLQALRNWAGEVFDAHAANPQFIRLVMGENLLGGRTVQQAPEIRQTNLLGLDELQTILQRGQADGSMRPDLAPLEVYANAVALAFHFDSNRSTFSAIFEQSSDPAQVQAARRACIQDTIERQVIAMA